MQNLPGSASGVHQYIRGKYSSRQPSSFQAARNHKKNPRPSGAFFAGQLGKGGECAGGLHRFPAPQVFRKRGAIGPGGNLAGSRRSGDFNRLRLEGTQVNKEPATGGPAIAQELPKIGSASCRERVSPYV